MRIYNPLQRHLIQANEGKRYQKQSYGLIETAIFFSIIGFGGAYFLGHILVWMFGVK